MCDPVAGGAATHHAEAAQTTTATQHAEKKPGETTNNWLEEAEKIKAPPIAASEQQWFDYAEKVAAAADLPVGLVTDMIKSKGAANALGGHSANDGTGEEVYGPLSVHSGLLEAGTYADTTHGLKDSAGKALTASEVAADPAKATVAGVQHIKQLVENYGGDLTKALNHYETGDPANSQHAMKDWCDGTSCQDDAGGHGAGGHHEAKDGDSGPILKSSKIFEQLASGGNSAIAESAGAGHHAASATATHSAQASAQNSAQHGGSEHSETAGAQHGGGHATKPVENSGHGASSKHEDHDHTSASGDSHQLVEKLQSAGASSAAGSGESSNSNPGLLPDKPFASSESSSPNPGLLPDKPFAYSESTHSAHGAGEHKPSSTQGQTGVTRETGLGTDRSLGEYITPDSHGPSQHIGEGHGLGFLMHRPTHDSAMETVFGKPASEVLSSVQSTLERTGTYLGNKPDTEKMKGAYLTTNMLMKQAMLPASMFGTEQEAGRTYADAKLTAISGNAEGLRDVIEQHGGETFDLTDDQLLNVWATNEHNNLHGILNAGSPIGQSIHMTSLNDNAHDGSAKGTMGGYNDKGEYPQWGWFNDIQNIGSQFSGLEVGRQFDSSYK